MKALEWQCPSCFERFSRRDVLQRLASYLFQTANLTRSKAHSILVQKVHARNVYHMVGDQSSLDFNTGTALSLQKSPYNN